MINKSIIENFARFMRKNRIYVFFVVTIILVLILIVDSGELKTQAISNENKHEQYTEEQYILVAEEVSREVENVVCRDAVKAYYCNSIDLCGRGSCIPPNTIRCDDKPDGSTYDCRMGQSCGRGKCIPEGKKMCEILPSSRECRNTHSCCRGTNPTNSKISCFPSGKCPIGSIGVPEYQHPHYQHFGEAHVTRR